MDIEKQRCRTDAAAVDVEVEQGHAARLEVDSRPRPGLSPAMGTIRIPKISVRLPIYHGTSQSEIGRAHV